MLFYQLESYVPTIPQKVPEIEFLKPINNTSNLLPFCNPLNNSFNIMKGFKKNCLIQ